MPSLVDSIIESKTVHSADGEAVTLHSHTSDEQGRFLQQFIEREHVSTALEIGLAYGISALFICECLAKKARPRFISVDMNQSDWKNIGTANLRRAGFDAFTEFHAGLSREVLPRLIEAGKRIDFAYIDTSKIFDVVLMDAVFTCTMLNVGGYIAFDDVGQPGIRRVARYLAKWPHLKVVGCHGAWPVSAKRRLLNLVAKCLPRRLVRDDLLTPDARLGIDGNCVVFQKIAEDERPWNWGEAP